MWELDRTLLQQHAAPLVEGYTWETGTLLRALDMDELLPAQAATGAEAKLGGPRVARRIQRSGRSVPRGGQAVLRACSRWLIRS